MSSSAFRLALEQGDVALLRQAWATLFPHLPQPADDAQAEIVMHRARTEAVSIPLRQRAYSHRWLVERLLPSGLPDDLRPKAERMYPIISSGVGISVKASSTWMQPAADEVRQAMEVAVMDAHSDGRLEDVVFVRSQMESARAKTLKALFG